MQGLEYKKLYLVALLLLGATFMAFGTGLGNGFLIDDNGTVVYNSQIKNLALISRVFTQPFLKKYYRPMTLVSLALDYAVWKLNPFGYHLTNILLHFLNSVLIFILVYLLWSRFKLALITSLLFAIHPLNSITVNYITDRHNLLAGFFMFASLIIFSFGYQRRMGKLFLLGFLFFIFALLSRENAILFPLYLGFVLLVLYPKGDTRHIALLIASSIFLSLIYLMLRMKYFTLSTVVLPDSHLLFSWQSLSAFFFLIFRFFLLAILPYNICMVYALQPNVASFSAALFYMTSVILGVLFLLIKFRKNKVIIFSTGWFFAGVLPLYNVMFFQPLIGLVVYDAHLYFSSLGLLIILSSIFIYLQAHINKKLWSVFIFCVFLYFINLSLANNRLWKSTETYSLYWLKQTPKNYIAYSGLADFYAMNKEYQKAKHYFDKAIEYSTLEHPRSLNEIMLMKKSLSNIFTSLGCISQEQGNLEEARQYFEKSAAINPHNPHPYFRLGFIYLLKKDVDKAIYYYRETIKRDYYYLDAHRQLALIYAERGDLQRAREEGKIALSINPDCFQDIVETLEKAGIELNP